MVALAYGGSLAVIEKLLLIVLNVKKKHTTEYLVCVECVMLS